MERNDPEMVLFSGAVGRAYHKLYEPFLSQKDELALLTNFTLQAPQKVKAKAIRKLLQNSIEGQEDLKQQLDLLLKDDDKVFDELIDLIKKGLSSSS